MAGTQKAPSCTSQLIHTGSLQYMSLILAIANGAETLAVTYQKLSTLIFSSICCLSALLSGTFSFVIKTHF